MSDEAADPKKKGKPAGAGGMPDAADGAENDDAFTAALLGGSEAPPPPEAKSSAQASKLDLSKALAPPPSTTGLSAPSRPKPPAPPSIAGLNSPEKSSPAASPPTKSAPSAALSPPTPLPTEPGSSPSQAALPPPPNLHGVGRAGPAVNPVRYRKKPSEPAPPASAFVDMLEPSAPPAPVAARTPPSVVGVGTGRAHWLLVAAAAVFAAALALLFAKMTAPGALVVTVAMASDSDEVAVFVNGEQRCAKTPCAVQGLSSGSFLVKASAKDHETSADQAITVEGGKISVVSLRLELSHPPPEDDAADEVEASTMAAADVDAEPAASAAPSADVLSMADLEASDEDNGNKSGKKTPGKTKRPAAGGGSAKLNLTSIPPAKVLVNGRPVGRTPLRGVPVPAGKLSVLFVHPEHGRKTEVVNVQPGTTRTVFANLK